MNKYKQCNIYINKCKMNTPALVGLVGHRGAELEIWAIKKKKKKK